MYDQVVAMTKIAYIFPGQGAQYVGMGKTLYDSFPAAKKIFDEADDILGFDITKLCFEGPLEELSQTVNSQPAILVHAIAALTALQGLTKEYTVACTLGLSVGEYIALVACGAVSYPEGLRLLRKRAMFMEEASKQNPGTMVAILGLGIEAIDAICQKTKAEIANLNCPGQVVVSGSPEAIKNTATLADEQSATRVVPLNVSGGFHSSLMTPAAERLKAELENIEIKKPTIPIVSNVAPKFEDDPAVIKKNLIVQLTHRTLWEASIRMVAQSGVTTFFELGPGKVLRGLLRRIDSKLTVRNFDTAQDLSSVTSTA
jgi:[acyl-carrier-protein] S-malonyltransferase